MALEKTTISRTCASYITTHGVARCLKDELKLKLKDKQLSLNRKQERESIKRKKESTGNGRMSRWKRIKML